MCTIEGTNYSVCKSRKDGCLYYEFGNGWKIANSSQIEDLTVLLEQCRRRLKDRTDKEVFEELKDRILANEITEENKASKIDLVAISQKIMDFFSEFHFEPNFRFINTFAYMCQKSLEDTKNYVNNYFELSDSAYTSSIREKMRSPEFSQIYADLAGYVTSSHRVNQRFKLYYGSQGTGKTTKALQESNGKCMVCHSAMLPSDLMEDFKFVDGNPTFEHSALWDAMINGEVIVLDEINLLPFESLRFLQSILDGKASFLYKGQEVQIADGFQIIGTMNLVVNGCTYALPEPLIDRAEDLRSFKLCAADLSMALA